MSFFYISGHLARDDTTHSGLSTPTLIIYEDNGPQTFLQATPTV